MKNWPGGKTSWDLDSGVRSLHGVLCVDSGLWIINYELRDASFGGKVGDSWRGGFHDGWRVARGIFAAVLEICCDLFLRSWEGKGF